MKHRIFLIGFNKCGTTSFHGFFKQNNINSVHWRGNTLATRLYDSLKAGSSDLLGDLDRWHAYTDMICIPGAPWHSPNSEHYPVIEACRYFRELDKCYPQSLFILNTRRPGDWLQSRLKHDCGRFASAYERCLKRQGLLTDETITEYWLRIWHEHHADVREYFGKASSDRFLYFNIDKTNRESLATFIGRYYEISSGYFPHAHRTIG